MNGGVRASLLSVGVEVGVGRGGDEVVVIETQVSGKNMS